jgi:hypothetical protein
VIKDEETTIREWLSARAAPGGKPQPGFISRRPEHAEALERVRDWTRRRFALPGEATILAAEIACALPGCPPLETIVVFWSDAATRHRFKVFKPVEQVVEDDLPYAWLKEALIDDGSGFECC